MYSIFGSYNFLDSILSEAADENYDNAMIPNTMRDRDAAAAVVPTTTTAS